MYIHDSSFLNARLLAVADIDSLGGDFQTLRELREEWEGLFDI
ncbi:hypothetical protein [Rhizobium sp. NFR12]|nr:hypothetical protein [Rhizobium sp. NFR12]SEH24078.1 hypothetical protein SAMN03159407_2019 [Rhizobium sp. NFR12]